MPQLIENWGCLSPPQDAVRMKTGTDATQLRMTICTDATELWMSNLYGCNSGVERTSTDAIQV